MGNQLKMENNRRYSKTCCTKRRVIICLVIGLIIVGTTIPIFVVVYKKKHDGQAADTSGAQASENTACPLHESEIEVLINPVASKCDSDSCFKCEKEVPAVSFYNDTEAACDIYNITSEGYLNINNYLFTYDEVKSETFRPPSPEKKFYSKCCMLSQIGQKVNKCSPGSNFTCYNRDREPICKCPTGRKGLSCEESSMNRMECKCFQCPHKFTIQDSLDDCFSPEKSLNSKECRLQKDGLNCYCSIYSDKVLPKC